MVGEFLVEQVEQNHKQSQIEGELLANDSQIWYQVAQDSRRGILARQTEWDDY